MIKWTVTPAALIKKLARRFRSLPSHLAGRISAHLHDKHWTSPEMTVPSSIKIEEIIEFLEQSGVRPGDTLFVHSSWENLNSGFFSAADLIKAIMAYLGPEGTLAMPAFPPFAMQVSGALFDAKRTPSGGGLLTEVFRRYPGVSRSINLNHSVCAIGRNADFLTKDHHRSETAWDEHSPYYRLREFENAWIVGFGVGHRLKVATALHCVESALSKENNYFKKLFKEELVYSYKKPDGELGEHSYKRRSGQIYTPKIAKHFTAEELRESTVAGLELYSIRARTLIDKAIELGRTGKTMYIWPLPYPWFF